MQITILSPPLISVHDRNVKQLINPQNIVRILGSGNYSIIFLSDGRQILASRTLKFYERLLPAHFLRIHKAHLVNEYFVATCSPVGTMMLTDGSQVPLARRKVSYFRNRYNTLT